MMRKLFLVCFFLIQLLAIGLVIGKDIKFFAWVPFDQISTYEIFVKLGQNELSQDQVFRRYKLRNPGRENRAIGHVFWQIQRYEDTYGRLDSAKVKVVYNVNGKATQTWVLQD